LGNLTYPNLPPPTGNSVAFYSVQGRGARLNLNGVITSANKAYYSYILKITDISNVPTYKTNNYFAAFSDGTATQPNLLARAGTRVLTMKTNAGFVLGVSKTGNNADMVFDTTVYNVNDVLFIVGSYEIIGTVTNCNLWINPPASSFGSNSPPAPNVTASAHSGGSTALNPTSVAAFAINCQSPAGPVGIIDELRVGTNWTFVTGGDPAILSVPANQTVPPGATAHFSVAARGTATLSYRWYKDGNPLSDIGNISGSGTTNLVVSSVGVGDIGAYAMYVTNGSGSFVQSASANLNLSDPAITGQPQDRTNNFGTTATFQVSTLGTAPFSYLWHKTGTGDLSDGGNISGSHSNVLTLTGVSAPDAGTYTVTVSNSVGTADSSNAVLTVLDPIITTQPVSVTNVAGSNVTFSVVASGSGTFTYQWYKNGSQIFDGGNLSGTASDTLSISTISLSDDADYNVVVTGAGTASSAQAHLTVETPVTITVQPTPRTVAAGSSTIMAVGATGFAPLRYQWQLEGTNVPGATSSAYNIVNVQPALTGNYRVIVSNFLNSATSSVAVLSIASSLHVYSSNLAVLRIGDGAQSLTVNGNSMFIDQFAPNGSCVSTLKIPDAGTNATITMGPTIVPVGATTSVTGSGMSRSLDGRQLVIAAYNTAVGFGSPLNNAPSTTVPRAVGWINSLGQYTLSLSSTDLTFTSTFFRAAVSDGTNNFWGAARTPSTYYFGFDAPAATIQSVFPNMRSMALFNGSIYCVSAVGGGNGVLKLDGMPMTSATANPTVLFPGSTASSDLDVSPDGNLIYVADSRNAPSGGIQRWQFDTNSSTWSLAYTLSDQLPSGAYYVTADWSGANPVVYAVTSDDSNNRLVQISDTGPSSTGATLAYAGVNQNFRGVRFGPAETTVVARPTLSITPNGNSVIVQWIGAFVLQSATNVGGPYADVVPTASSPYTNSTAPGQMFFRLRN
jgi:hypothetical protein